MSLKPGQGFVVNHDNQVVNGQTLQYDLDGELVNDGVNQYSWDAANRLTQITELHPSNSQPAHTSQFVYDGFGRRVEDKELDGVQLVQDRKFIWVGENMREERDQHGNVVKRFYNGGAQVVSGISPGNYYYLRDHLGSIREVMDSNGNVVAVLDYDQWGNETQTTGTFAPDFGYAGYFEHQPSGLALTMYRAYSPMLGRWISRDPAGEWNGGVNLFDYVANMPLAFTDPYGLWTIQVGASEAAGALGGQNSGAGIVIGYSNSNGFQIGGYGTVGGSEYWGFGGGLSLAVTVTNAQGIQCLGGAGGEIGGSIGEVVVGGGRGVAGEGSPSFGPIITGILQVPG